MTNDDVTTTTDVPAVAAAIRSHARFCVVTHENPDGDALGSMLGAKLGLDALGKDAVMYLSGVGPAARASFTSSPLDGLVRVVPDDLEERVLLAVDCANERRIGPEPDAVERAQLVINVDHHHDNSRFGAVNLIVDDASSTAEIVRDILGALDVPLTPEIAEALYVGLVTDTGRFQYTNTTPKALRLAAELVEAGANVHDIFRHVYETVQFAKLKLLARALERAELYEGGRLVVSYLLRDDFARGRGGGAVLGGHHRLAARGRGLGDGGADPRAAARRRAGAPDLAALEPRRGRRVGDRARARTAAVTARRPGSRPTSRSPRSPTSCTASSSASRPAPAAAPTQA